MHRAQPAALIAALLVLMLAGCVSPTPAEPPAVATTQPARIAPSTGAPNVLRWAIEGVSNLPSLDPAMTSNNSSVTVMNLVYGGLVRLNEQLEVVPDAAETWMVSEDERTYTFVLRERLLFADGTPVTADDFVFSITRTLLPETGAPTAIGFLRHIVGAQDVASGKTRTLSGVRAIDQRTLEIELDEPVAYFLSQLTFPYTFVVPRTLLESGADWQLRAYGTGPFKVKQWAINEQIILEPNPNYWGGQVQLREIQMPFIPNSEQAYQRYLAGELDIMGSQQNGVPASRVVEVQGLADFRSIPALVVRYIGFNNQRSPFNSMQVRRAFALATDKTAIAEQILANTARPAERILPPGLMGTQFPIAPLAFDPQAARQLLADAGYPDGRGLPALTIAYGLEGDNELVLRELQEQWRRNLGVQVELNGMPVEQFSQRLNETFADPQSGLQFYYSIWGADYPDPHNFLSLQLRSNSAYNNGRFSDPEFDQLTTQADTIGERDQLERRMQLYNRAEQIAIDNVGWLPISNPLINVLVRPGVQGLVFTPQNILAPDWTQVTVTP